MPSEWKWPHSGASRPRRRMKAKWKTRWDGRIARKSEKDRLKDCKCKLEREDLCEFLIWFAEKFYPDYLQVRAALCNVERRAFGFGTGGSAAAAMCGDGPGDDPPPPPPPPTFN